MSERERRGREANSSSLLVITCNGKINLVRQSDLQFGYTICFAVWSLAVGFPRVVIVRACVRACVCEFGCVCKQIY